jgi:hypothetical protein
MLRGRKRIEPYNGVESTASASGDGPSVRRPLRIHFVPPANPSAWHMTGRINWPCPYQSYETVPVCEWANHEGVRIWLSAQHNDLVTEFTDRAEDRRRKLVKRRRKFLTGVFLCIILCCLQSAADVGI